MENYHVIEFMGEGSFGKVYKGRRKYTDQVLFLLPFASCDYSTSRLSVICASCRWSFASRFCSKIHIIQCAAIALRCLQTVAMKFIVKHGKSDKDIDNLRQEIEVYFYGL